MFLLFAVPPHLKGDGMYDITLKKGRPIRYDIWFGGEPAPNVEWLREGRTLGPDENTSIELYSKNTIYTEKNTVLSIPKVQPFYFVHFSNTLGNLQIAKCLARYNFIFSMANLGKTLSPNPSTLVLHRFMNFSPGRPRSRHRCLHHQADLRGRDLRGERSGQRARRAHQAEEPHAGRGQGRARQTQLAAARGRRRDSHHQLPGQIHGHRHWRVGLRLHCK